MDQKTNQLLQEIDLARCRAQWSTALELAKKYKKTKPQDSGRTQRRRAVHAAHRLCPLPL